MADLPAGDGEPAAGAGFGAAPAAAASAKLALALKTPASTLCSGSGTARKILPEITPSVISPSSSFIAYPEEKDFCVAAYRGLVFQTLTTCGRFLSFRS